LNAYGMEDPIQTLIADGWRDAYAGRSPAPYSYVFDAQTGLLDHALLSPALAQRLAGAAKWHSNADEPERAETAPDAEGAAAARRAPRAAAPWRSSDHDPLLLGFRLRR
jgi:predicted extracellular nuclease